MGVAPPPGSYTPGGTYPTARPSGGSRTDHCSHRTDPEFGRHALRYGRRAFEETTMKISIEQPSSRTWNMRHTPLSEETDPLDEVGHASGIWVATIVPKPSGTVPPLCRASSRIADFAGRS